MIGSLFWRAAVAGGGGGITYLTSQQIAQELVSPTKLTHCFLMGDSRTTQKGVQIDQGNTQIAWAGFKVPFNRLNSTGHNAQASGITSGDNSTAAIYLAGDINSWCPWQAYEVEFTGSAEPSANALQSRCFYPTGDGPSAANFPNFWGYAVGRECKFRALAFRHAGAASTQPGITAHWRNTGTAFGGDNHNGSYVYDFTGSGYVEVSVTIPDTNDWATYTTPFAELVATPGGSTTASETIAFVDAWFEADAGTVLIDWSVGGRSIDGWRDDSVFDSGMFASLVPLYGENRMAWIDIGTNNPQANDQTTHETLVRAHIADFRTGSPGASVLLTSSYPAGNNNNAEPYYVAAHRSIGADDGVLFIDTWNAMPAFFDGVELGYYNVDLYTANGAQSSGSGTLVVNEAIDGGTAAAGSVFVENASGGIDVVPYASWSGSTFTLVGTLPDDVAANARVGWGDGTHYNDTGVVAFAETIGHLVAIKAGTFAPTDIPGMFFGVYGDDVTITSAPDIDQANDQSPDGNDAAQATVASKPHDIEWRNGRHAFDMDGTDDTLVVGVPSGGAEAQPYTALDVFEAPATTPGTTVFILGGDVPSARGDVFVTTSDTLAYYAGAQMTVSTALTASAPTIADAVLDGSSSDAHVIQDGEPVITQTGNVGSHSLGKISIGANESGTNNYPAPIAASFRWSGRLAPERRHVLREWAKAYYDITPA